METETASAPDRIRARRFAVNYNDSAVPRIWVEGDVFLTHWLNAYTMTVLDGEVFIIQTIKQAMDKLDEPRVRDDAQGLIGQEVSHSRGHSQFFDVLQQQGFKLKTYLAFTRFLSFKILAPLATQTQQLAFVVGVERINELFAEISLASGTLDKASPAVRSLYEWHFAEEIEHKAVAFDVYQAISGSRFWLGYGVVMSYLVNMGYLFLAFSTFMRQDGQLFKWKVWRRAFQYWFTKERFLPRMTRGCLQVLKRGFHPSQSDNRKLAEHVLRRRVIKADSAGDA
ncbi:hypothetical protein CAI21_16505 [Alkalilimnicola ehrlichii]|uniref:Metal-dependent hydrolase n=1 Tax=Alkalilimnicola ehrlichii TaxID=351052 RepID=A0A3E0WIW7_9GAMM|nr:metal-dependent hydrolase [Alkalilimnicola ehrlichii]RFA26566.1 hypothetical protein CAI21_16505 [Alkalilimnicola ehrlichii]RFA32930.1 hypothetical protein CAL65_18490 [Alkalilimnicola ehrlichii]